MNKPPRRQMQMMQMLQQHIRTKLQVIIWANAHQHPALEMKFYSDQKQSTNDALKKLLKNSLDQIKS